MRIKKDGFTLIELMIVVAIIALLASVALPKFANTTDAAKAANVQGNLANLRTAISMFKAKNGDYPTTGTAIANIASDGTLDKGAVANNFKDYYSKSKMPTTPAGKVKTDEVGTVAITATSAGTVGGWVYVSGEIHANLGDATINSDDGQYGQKIDWTEE